MTNTPEPAAALMAGWRSHVEAAGGRLIPHWGWKCSDCGLGGTVYTSEDDCRAALAAHRTASHAPRPVRYLLDRDDDGHWYLMPADVHGQFEEFVESCGELDQPAGVMRINAPSSITFEAPQEFCNPISEVS
jgi:hypothetical protein